MAERVIGAVSSAAVHERGQVWGWEFVAEIRCGPQRYRRRSCRWLRGCLRRLVWRGARGQAVQDLPEGQVVPFGFQVGPSAGVLVLAYSLNRRGESVVVSGSSPPVISSSLADLVDFPKSGADRVLKVLGRQGPSLVLCFGGEPIPSALLSAALTFGVPDIVRDTYARC